MSLSWKQPLDLIRVSTLLLVLLCIGFVTYAVIRYLGLPGDHLSTPPQIHAGGRAEWPDNTLPPPEAWSAVRGGGPAPAVTVAAQGGRFRLVGTYFMMPGGNDAEPTRKAVLDDLQQDTQVLVEELDSIDGIRVQTISRDHVVLAFPDGREVELWLRFGSGTPAVEPSPEDTPAEPTEPAWDEVTLETSRFGRRIAENRWILSRQELLAYREELLNDPERLASVFVAMKADRIDRKIEGYRLERQGEDAFWDAVGLRESDVIRKANSMKMTQQERSEYLISEFVANRLNVVVLDIERDGNPQKLIYYLRE